MTKRTDIKKMIGRMQKGSEFYANPINFSEKQINDLREMIQNGILEPINFIHRVTEEGTRQVIKGIMILPDSQYRKV